jgi:hypothetical protein
MVNKRRTRFWALGSASAFALTLAVAFGRLLHSKACADFSARAGFASAPEVAQSDAARSQEDAGVAACRFSNVQGLPGYHAPEIGEGAFAPGRVAVVVTHEIDGDRHASLLVFRDGSTPPIRVPIGVMHGFDPLPRVSVDGDTIWVGAVLRSDSGAQARSGVAGAQVRAVLLRLQGDTLAQVAQFAWPTSATTFDWTWAEGRALLAYDTVKGATEQIEVVDATSARVMAQVAAPLPEDLRFFRIGGRAGLVWSSGTTLPELDGGDPNEAPAERRSSRYIMTAELEPDGRTIGGARVRTDPKGRVGAFVVTRHALYLVDQNELAPGAGARALRIGRGLAGEFAEAAEVIARSLDLQVGIDVVDTEPAQPALIAFVDLDRRSRVRRARPIVENTEPGDDGTWEFREDARLFGVLDAQAFGLEVRQGSIETGPPGGDPAQAARPGSSARYELRRFSMMCP